MAMFSTFIAWGLWQAGFSPVLAVVCAVALSFLGGMLIERVVIRPVEGGEPLALVIVTLGLLILVNSLAGWIWGFNNRSFPSLFGDGSVEIGRAQTELQSQGHISYVVCGLNKK